MPSEIVGVPAPVREPLSLRALGIVLANHYGIHEGIYDVSVEFNIGVGAVGPNQESSSPGVMVGLQRIGLIAMPEGTPIAGVIFDAAKENPKPVRKKKSALK